MRVLTGHRREVGNGVEPVRQQPWANNKILNIYLI